MILEEQLNDSSSQSVTIQQDVNMPPVHQDAISNGSGDQMHIKQQGALFIGKVRLLISSDIFLSKESNLLPCEWEEIY